MGRAMRWLKKVLTGKKEGDKDRKEHSVDAGANGGMVPIERRRWSFARPRNSVADGSRRPSVTAVVAGELSQVRPCNCGQEREVAAAVMIQKTFRGYLARRALRALKSLVKLQALVRGYLVRKQTATTLQRLQALIRLQDSSRLKNAPYRKSVEQERIVVKMQGAPVRPSSLPVVHRRRVSDGGDANFDRSPRIVEMDTCQLRCRSSRITSRYAADPPPDVGALQGAVPLSSPLLYWYKPPSRLLPEHEPRHTKTTQNTPRLGALPACHVSSPAKPARASCREAAGSPRYMADTASSVARARCQSAPRQRHGGADAHDAALAEPRPSSLARAGSRKSRPDSASMKSSDLSRVEDSEFSDDVTRDYYLDQLW